MLHADLISASEEAGLIRHIETLSLAPFIFHGFEGKRRVAPFGWRYDFARRTLDRAPAIPDFLLPLRAQAAMMAGRPAEAFQQALILEYRAGAGIGWHRDRPQFGEIVGISLGTPCRLRLRRRRPNGWDRFAVEAAPRSAYLLSKAARDAWEHSIPPVDALRYAVTFRTVR